MKFTPRGGEIRVDVRDEGTAVAIVVSDTGQGIDRPFLPHVFEAPTLALWGELDNNIVADKNKPAWDAALKAAGNRDYTLVVVPKANHDMLEAKESNAEIKSLQRFVPSYFTTIEDWLAKRIRDFH